ncbi:MAG: 4-amino-4-deoxy-L-arabinose transferase [Isosphaeraceae bacterium]
MATSPLSRSAKPTPSAGSTIRQAGLAGLLAAAFFALGLGDRPFVDEYAYITQSYQPDLLLAGRADDPSWLDPLTYDLVPLPKYLINAAYRVAGIDRPRPLDAKSWYDNTAYRWGSTPQLLVARLPSVLMAGLGCAAIHALGSQVAGPLAGWLAAVLLAVNPLYRLHAHRAMSEAPCEALSLIALAVGLWAWKAALSRERGGPAALVAMAGAGLAAGLAILAKFNGMLVLMVLAAWCIFGVLLPWVPAARKGLLVLETGLAILIALAAFVALNPFFTVRPKGPLPPPLQALAELDTVGRFRFLMDHRLDVSRGQQRLFPHNALLSFADRAAVLAVQGFGRFGPLGPSDSDSTRRFDPRQDWGALLWLPLVLSGLAWAVVRASGDWRRGVPPLSGLVAIWACLAALVVGTYLPMAWDRYQLPVQAPACVLAACVLAAAGRRLGERFHTRAART